MLSRVGRDGQGDGYGRGLVGGQAGDGADDLAGCARFSDLAWRARLPSP